ncbi:hypothetical protein KP509_27G066400 [Ceratopteris richardii]|uniref:Uncharacterized protein n=1 Tax=Ceratopteris richardii TaxID=49495 RepID=A0A8T2RJA3_CERRI|nr:hypothetical protein KP509_27G066400 [Ceratopteris richardii]
MKQNRVTKISSEGETKKFFTTTEKLFSTVSLYDVQLCRHLYIHIIPETQIGPLRKGDACFRTFTKL